MQNTGIESVYDELVGAVKELVDTSTFWRVELTKEYTDKDQTSQDVRTDITDIAILASQDKIFDTILGSGLPPAKRESLRDIVILVRTHRTLTENLYTRLLNLGRTELSKKAAKKVTQARTNLSGKLDAALPYLTADEPVMATPKSDNLFIKLLKANKAPDSIVTQTRDLFDGRAPKPALKDADVTALVGAWEGVIDTFLKQFPIPPDQLNPDLASVAGLIEIHSLLEILYDQLIVIVESGQTSVTSLLSIR